MNASYHTVKVTWFQRGFGPYPQLLHPENSDEEDDQQPKGEDRFCELNVKSITPMCGLASFRGQNIVPYRVQQVSDDTTPIFARQAQLQAQRGETISEFLNGLKVRMLSSVCSLNRMPCYKSSSGEGSPEPFTPPAITDMEVKILSLINEERGVDLCRPDLQDELLDAFRPLQAAHSLLCVMSIRRPVVKEQEEDAVPTAGGGNNTVAGGAASPTMVKHSEFDASSPLSAQGPPSSVFGDVVETRVEVAVFYPNRLVPVLGAEGKKKKIVKKKTGDPDHLKTIRVSRPTEQGATVGDLIKNIETRIRELNNSTQLRVARVVKRETHLKLRDLDHSKRAKKKGKVGLHENIEAVVVRAELFSTMASTLNECVFEVVDSPHPNPHHPTANVASQSADRKKRSRSGYAAFHENDNTSDKQGSEDAPKNSQADRGKRTRSGLEGIQTYSDPNDSPSADCVSQHRVSQDQILRNSVTPQKVASGSQTPKMEETDGAIGVPPGDEAPLPRVPYTGPLLDIGKMNGKKLKKELKDRGVTDTSDCLTSEDLRKRLARIREECETIDTAEDRGMPGEVEKQEEDGEQEEEEDQIGVDEEKEGEDEEEEEEEDASASGSRPSEGAATSGEGSGDEEVEEEESGEGSDADGDEEDEEGSESDSGSGESDGDTTSGSSVVSKLGIYMTQHRATQHAFEREGESSSSSDSSGGGGFREASQAHQWEATLSETPQKQPATTESRGGTTLGTLSQSRARVRAPSYNIIATPKIPMTPLRMESQTLVEEPHYRSGTRRTTTMSQDRVSENSNPSSHNENDDGGGQTRRRGSPTVQAPSGGELQRRRIEESFRDDGQYADEDRKWDASTESVIPLEDVTLVEQGDQPPADGAEDREHGTDTGSSASRNSESWRSLGSDVSI